MSQSFIERERKLDVDPDFEVPDLAAVVPPGSTALRSIQQLRSEYFDTIDHALRDAGVTLRRRSGTDDTGWHLKLPSGEHREELHFDLADDVPVGATRLLLGITRGAPLSPIATIETERHVTRILDSADDAVADIDLDHVRATSTRDGRSTVSSWTELEVELGSPSVSEEQLAVLDRRLRDAGARPPRSTSKLERALGETASKPKKKHGNAAKQRAGAVLVPYLSEQQRMLLLGDVALRRHDDSVIHKTRVATRRLRSILRVFEPFFDPDRAHALDGELRWWAEILGAVRDSQVLEQRLHDALADVSPDLVVGPVLQRIDAHLHARREQDWERLRQTLLEPRYLDLLGEVASWVTSPPFVGRASRPATEITRLARRANKTVTTRLKRANKAGDVDLLHRARKAAKRARYAAEAATSVEGKRALREVEQYRHLQDLLGEHQDSVVAAQLLRELGAAAGIADGEDGFTFGLLHQREEQRATAARRKAHRTARRYA